MHTLAESVVYDFGIADPAEIDVEAIAFERGVIVRRLPLVGCEARIVGHGDRAIVSVDSTKSPRRQRFSIAHELGHWQLHRGQVLFCASSDIGDGRASESERMANRYAADLLMPRYLFLPRALAVREPTWTGVEQLSDAFKTSRPATAIRLVELDAFPIILVCHRQAGRQWFKCSPSTDDWHVRADLDSRTAAIELLYGTTSELPPRSLTGDAWLTGAAAGRFRIVEHSIRSADSVYSLLWLNDRGLARPR